MRFFQTIAALFKAWADLVAETLIRMVDRVASPGAASLVEREDGWFILDTDGVGGPRTFSNGRFLPDADMQTLKGRRLEIRLKPSRFVFRTLEFPTQAGGFLEGIVRAQIDRLTPWTAATAAFGLTPPQARDGDRIATEMAVTTRSTIMPFVDAALAYRPSSVAVSTTSEKESRPVTVFEQKASGVLSAARLSAGLRVSTAALAAAAALSFAVSAVVTARFDSQRDEALAQISRQQRAMRAVQDSPERAAVKALERRKQEVAPVTLVLDNLTEALPDNTYATELHIIGNRMQVAGISADAPSLIRLLELKPLFSRATFYAPTTRSASESGERFSIEAKIEPKVIGGRR